MDPRDRPDGTGPGTSARGGTDVGDVLDLLDPATSAWFHEAFGAPTPAQDGAWRAISSGDDTLVIAPTGSGKTLAAFLTAIDGLAFAPPGEERRPESGVQVLYISPLKALGVDVQRNLTSPLVGTARTAERLGREHHTISVGVRTGDTPQQERRRLVAHPPDVLITTPESLFLMLSSRARESLRTVRTVILDEVHAVAGTKRGVHLGLSLARLDALAYEAPQRIGLSATVEPVDDVATFLTGTGRDRALSVVRPPSDKQWDLAVRQPVPDLQHIDPPSDAFEEEDVTGTVWPHVQRAVLDEVLAHRSTIVFTNARGQAERLTSALNLLHRRRLAASAGAQPTTPDPLVPAPSQMGSARSAADPTQDAQVGEIPDVARAHHGSMSKEHRAQIEEQLKGGSLRCVVATSSLELGIDMGAVDLVIQIGAPPAISSAVQRFGRAGHEVGAVSHGVLHPLHAADVLHGAVTVREALAGRIEPLHMPRNALDVLAQHTVSAAVGEDLDIEDWFDLVRTAAGYRELSRSVFDGVLDLLSGRYPSTAFSGLRPRLIRDREAGTLSARPGAGRLVVTSGGTIPDRGLFPVFLAATDETRQARRVGELDEEMVYESRRGDVITLGTSSWRIEEITHDRVSVSPAFGQMGRIPFWHGEGNGRPAELGRAIGSFQAELADRTPQKARDQLRSIGLEGNAAGEVVRYLGEQEEATAVVPSSEQLVVERFADELGDWRVVLHCPLGRRITGPWALAVGARIEERYGLDGQVMAADDGIVARIPHGEEAPGADLFVFGPEQIEQDVRELVGTSSLFAARFRECSARALLLPRRDPGTRAPLWQQRKRAADLLDIARAYPEFPMMLETARECLQDVYDLPELVALMTRIGSRQVQVREVETPDPSPFARSLLLGYMAQFIYDTDAPLAERRTSALALDQSLLAELLGTVSLRELLDVGVIDEVEASLQGLTENQALRDAEGMADALRRLGPLSREELSERSQSEFAVDDAVAALVDSRRAIRVRVAGTERIAGIEDAGLLRDGLGVALPPGVPHAYLEAVDDPVAQLLMRWSRTRGPFTGEQVREEFALAPGVVRAVLDQLTDRRILTRGEFTPGRTGEEWVDTQVLQRIRRASLAASRRDIQPVTGAVYTRFLGRWQHLVARDAEGTAERASLRGADGIEAVIDQLSGVSLPLSAWEQQVLPARLPDYTPAALDALLASGQVVWTGHGRLGTTDAWVRLHLAGALPLGVDAEEIEQRAGALDEDSLAGRILTLLRSTPGALRHGEILTALADEGRAAGAEDVVEALWELAFSSLITGDSFESLRSYARGKPSAGSNRRGGGRSRPTSRRGAARLSAAMMRAGASSPEQLVTGDVPGGRWSAVRVEPVDPTARAGALATLLMDRHGVITRDAMSIEDVPGSFAAVYRVLATLEENGSARRGYFVVGLGASQFAPAEAVDLLRDRDREQPAGRAVALAATDPANPYGAALPWPEPSIAPPEGRNLHPARRSGALVVLVDGAPAAFVDKGAKSLVWFAPGQDTENAAAPLVRAIVEDSRLPQLAIERINGHGIADPEVAHVADALVDAGCYRSPRALRVRAGGR